MKYLTYQQVISFSTLTENQTGRRQSTKHPSLLLTPFLSWPRTKAEMASDKHEKPSYPHLVRLHCCLPQVLPFTDFLMQSYPLPLFLLTMHRYSCRDRLGKL